MWRLTLAIIVLGLFLYSVFKLFLYKKQNPEKDVLYWLIIILFVPVVGPIYFLMKHNDS
ncbi:MAG: hypothetical protein ACFB0B_05875 [Thermonemataceae bacterium]